MPDHRPVVGITTYGRVERPTPNAHYPAFYTVPVSYVAAVRKAGAVPVLIPPGETTGLDWLDRLDGMVIAGGTDVDPDRYGAQRQAVVLDPDPERDESEIALTEELLARDVPTLFVCRGMQVLNVTLGGTLYPHIPDLGRGDIHRDDEGLWIKHDIAVESGSLLARAMGTTKVSTVSGHHQAVKRVAEGLTVTATAPDGLIEAVEVADRTWMVGVQWHPEVTAPGDQTQQGLFDTLVSRTRAGSGLSTRVEGLSP